MQAIRWAGEADRYFGPFTYARERNRGGHIAMMLGSGDNDEYPGCRLRLSAFGHTLIIALPTLIHPWRRWVDTTDRPWNQGKGPSGYWDQHQREFGFYVSEGHFCIHFGAQTHDSRTTQSWSTFLPWTQWRFVRHSLYGLVGEHVWTEPQRRWNKHTPWAQRSAHLDRCREAKDACPSRTFQFVDFDGEHLTAATIIEEREWLFGEKAFKWLSLFCRPKIRRSLAIEFSGETGRRKGSWKGGTVGSGIDMLPGELHEAAFRRYCVANNMTFVSVAPDA